MAEIVAHHGWFKDTNLHLDDTGGTGRPVAMIHGWPLSGESWSAQVPAPVQAGHGVVPHDRRGFGRSDPPTSGSTYVTLAVDLHTLLTELDLHDVTLVGFSMGGSEVDRYLVTYGPERMQSVVFTAGPPYLTPGNPDGPLAESEAAKMSAGLTADREKFCDGFTTDFFSVDGVLTGQRTAAAGGAGPAGRRERRAAVHGRVRQHPLPRRPGDHKPKEATCGSATTRSPGAASPAPRPA